MVADLDFLDEEFRELEREVVQRHCPHFRRIDDTCMGELPTAICVDCGKRGPSEATVAHRHPMIVNETW